MTEAGTTTAGRGGVQNCPWACDHDPARLSSSQMPGELRAHTGSEDVQRGTHAPVGPTLPAVPAAANCIPQRHQVGKRKSQTPHVTIPLTSNV